MKYFDEWAKDKKPLLATIALIIASSVEDCYELFGSVKGGKRIEGAVSLPHLKNWLKMYQNPPKVVIGLFSALSNHDSRLAGILYFYKMILKFDKMSSSEMREIWNEIQNMTDEKKNEIREHVNSLLKTYRQMAVQVVNNDGEQGKGPDDGKKKQLDELPHKPGGLGS